MMALSSGPLQNIVKRFSPWAAIYNQPALLELNSSKFWINVQNNYAKPLKLESSRLENIKLRNRIHELEEFLRDAEQERDMFRE